MSQLEPRITPGAWAVGALLTPEWREIALRETPHVAILVARGFAEARYVTPCGAATLLDRATLLGGAPVLEVRAAAREPGARVPHFPARPETYVVRKKLKGQAQ